MGRHRDPEQGQDRRRDIECMRLLHLASRDPVIGEPEAGVPRMLTGPVRDANRNLDQADALGHASVEHSEIGAKAHHKVGEVRMTIGAERLFGCHDTGDDRLAALRMLELQQCATQLCE